MTAAAFHADPDAAQPIAAHETPDRLVRLFAVRRDDFRPHDGQTTPVPRPPADRTDPRVAVLNELERVLASATFRHSQRHRTFLRYVVEAALAGRKDDLREVVIGLAVFGRQLNGYDPDRDSIVRVEARRLRRKLGDYYAREGAANALEIRIPTGSYVPVFEARTADLARMPCVLVLPLQVVNGDEARRGLAIGLVDQVIVRLGSDVGLRVMAPIAAALREQAAEVEALRRDRRADYVIDGSLTCHGSRIRCVAHLSRTADRIRVWSGRFDFDAEAGHAADRDLFAFQDRIADAIVAAVGSEKEGA